MEMIGFLGEWKHESKAEPILVLEMPGVSDDKNQFVKIMADASVKLE
jgi:hypothetical protein